MSVTSRFLFHVCSGSASAINNPIFDAQQHSCPVRFPALAHRSAQHEVIDNSRPYAVLARPFGNGFAALLKLGANLLNCSDVAP